MKNRKAFTFLLCFVVVLAMTFGVLAAAADKAAGEAEAPAEETAAAVPVQAAEEEQPEAAAEEAAAEGVAPAEEPAAEPEVPEPAEPAVQQSTAPTAGQGTSFFDRLMACNSLDDLWAMLDSASEEVLAALSEEQNQQLDAHITALEPAPAPAVAAENGNEATVPSEIVHPSVNYTNVAPLGAPVTGGPTE